MQLLQMQTQVWQFLFHHIPHEHKVNTKVFVDELVAHSGDLPPLNRRVESTSALRNSLDRLADDLDIADHGVLRLAVREERLLAVGGVVRDGVDRLDRVREVSTLVLHRTTASAYIRSRKCGLTPPSLRTSTWVPSRYSRSCQSPTRSSRLRPGSICTRRSTSLAASGSPRAIDPNTRTLLAPCSAAQVRISSRRARSRTRSRLGVERLMTETTLPPARAVRTLAASTDLGKDPPALWLGELSDEWRILAQVVRISTVCRYRVADAR